MKRAELAELHFIAAIDDVPSICRLGILSHRRAKRVPHRSIAMQVIQDKRAEVTVPGGRRLHEYANLYVNARNPMLCKRQTRHEELCVLRVHTDVLDLPGVVVTDMNASSKYRRFAAAPGGLAIVDREQTFAESWNHPEDMIRHWQHKARMCAEVLVPDRVDPAFITEFYASCNGSVAILDGLKTGIPATANPHLFFQ